MTARCSQSRESGSFGPRSSQGTAATRKSSIFSLISLSSSRFARSWLVKIIVLPRVFSSCRMFFMNRPGVSGDSIL